MAIVSYSEIYNWPTYYEDGDVLKSFYYDTEFYKRLEIWANWYYYRIPWSNPGRVYSLGTYIPGQTGPHGSARGFDLTRIYLNGVATLACDARTVPTSTTRKRYWATAASLHYHFKDVITYPWDSLHHNHIHVDNWASGNVNSVFTTSAKAQVYFVQYSLVYVWGYTAVGMDGVYGPQTADYASRALDRSGAPGALTTLANWQRFCDTTTRFGSGSSSYP